MIDKNTSVPGMFIGCLPLTSLRLSKLECFYDQNCIHQIINVLNLQNISITALNPNEISQYVMNTTLDHIIDNLMLEEWTNYTNYNEYFYQCNTLQCTYSKTERNNLLVIVTTLLGLCKFN